MNGTDTIIGAMSSEDLAGLKVKYADNASVVLLIDGILQTREREVTQAKARVDFESSLARFVNGRTKKGKPYLPHPDDVHNILIRWGEAEVEDTTQEPEMVDIVTKQAVLDGDSNIIEPAVVEPQPRYPMVKVYQWIVEVNHATRPTSTGSDAPKPSGRAVTVFKREGLALVDKGNYPSATKACEHLKLLIGGDSATRVLTRDGYLTEPYKGTEFTS